MLLNYLVYINDHNNNYQLGIDQVQYNQSINQQGLYSITLNSPKTTWKMWKLYCSVLHSHLTIRKAKLQTLNN